MERLEDHIKALKSDLESYRRDILTCVDAQYEDGSNSSTLNNDIIIDLKNDPSNSLFILRQDLSDLINQHLKLKSNTSISSSNDIEDCSQQLCLLEKVSKISKALLDLEVKIGGNNMKETCDLIKTLESQITDLPQETYGLGHTWKLLKKEVRSIRHRFHSRLQRLLEHAYIIEYGRIVIHKSISGVVAGEDTVIKDPIAVEDVWLALLSLELADESVRTIMSDLWTNLIKPLWKERKQPNIKTSPSVATSEFVVDLMPLSASTRPLDPEGNQISSRALNANGAHQFASRLPVGQLFDSLGHIFSFMFVEMFFGMDQLSSSIAKALTAPPSTLLKSLFDTVIVSQPKNESDMPAYQKSLDRPIREFEKKLQTFNLLSYGPEEAKLLQNMSNRSNYVGINASQPLTELLNHLSDRFVEMRRKDILQRARELLLADYHNVMLASGDALEDDPASAGNVGDPRAMLEQSGTYALQTLRFDPCQVSLAACRLLKLIHEVMKQISLASPIVAKVLVQTVRDCLDLFTIVIPLKYSDAIHSQPRIGAIYYNDCIYIAHNTTLLTHHYREEAMQHCLGFIDMIPRFRESGEKILGYHIEEQRKLIADLVTSVNISCLESSQEKGHVDSRGRVKPANNEIAVKNILSVFEKLRDQWNDVLQDEVYERLLGHLVEGVLRDMMDPIVAADCIAESSAADISRLFRSLQKVR